jgi:hypothetical protein
MLINGILTAAALAMITPMLVPSRWRARRTDEGEAAGTGDMFGLGDTVAARAPAGAADQPPNLGSIPAEVLTPLPTAPWSAARSEVNPPVAERR